VGGTIGQNVSVAAGHTFSFRNVSISHRQMLLLDVLPLTLRELVSMAVHLTSITARPCTFWSNCKAIGAVPAHILRKQRE
jgi:hypothetical protein